MIKYYNVEGSIFSFKDEKLTPAHREWISINNMYLIDEDGIIEGKEVHAGDVIITFYSDDPINFAIVDKDDSFARIFKEAIELRKEQKVKDSPYCDCECNCKAA